MQLTVTIDKAGRVVIPKKIRDELRLGAGDTLTLEREGERLTLRPVHAGTPLQRNAAYGFFKAASRFRWTKPISSCATCNETVRTPVSAAGEGIL
jgi:AbrB family looped-hinge helix DNA binding protein